jgi:hypothetical protein
MRVPRTACRDAPAPPQRCARAFARRRPLSANTVLNPTHREPCPDSIHQAGGAGEPYTQIRGTPAPYRQTIWRVPSGPSRQRPETTGGSGRRPRQPLRGQRSLPVPRTSGSPGASDAWCWHGEDFLYDLQGRLASLAAGAAARAAGARKLASSPAAWRPTCNKRHTLATRTSSTSPAVAPRGATAPARVCALSPAQRDTPAHRPSRPEGDPGGTPHRPAPIGSQLSLIVAAVSERRKGD